ncbi:DnaJ domain-containing protein [Reichenbachiella carrageenanivorans]|nr:DnaJ domain-containing protein [Reichenbachiella carrageenanivorans]
MQNHYLSVLELAPGATKTEVKSAYRQLSKRYHPDVSKDENAREKFIEINEAYKFLTAVGPRPVHIAPSASAYDYDAQSDAYDGWRRMAKEYARKQAQEAIRRQQRLTKSLLKGFDLVLLIVVLFNLVLLVDSHLPLVATTHQEMTDTQILKYQNAYYDILEVDDYVFYLKGGVLKDLRGGRYEKAVVYATPWLDKPQALDLDMGRRVYQFVQYAGVYGFFSFFIQTILLLALIYKVWVRSLDSQLSVSICILFLAVFQLFLFSTY